VKAVVDALDPIGVVAGLHDQIRDLARRECSTMQVPRCTGKGSVQRTSACARTAVDRVLERVANGYVKPDEAIGEDSKLTCGSLWRHAEELVRVRHIERPRLPFLWSWKWRQTPSTALSARSTTRRAQLNGALPQFFVQFEAGLQQPRLDLNRHAFQCAGHVEDGLREGADRGGQGHVIAREQLAQCFADSRFLAPRFLAGAARGRGNVSTLPRDSTQDDGHGAAEERPDKPALAVERDGFNVHAGVRIEAGDDLGRERLARYGARPPLSLERLRRLPGGRVAYRLKYVDRGRRGKNRVMTGIEFMARLAAIIAPPRYPLVRFAGVLAPRSAWRREVVPEPREQRAPCEAARTQKPGPTERRPEQHPAGDARGGPAPRAPSPPEASDTHRGPAMSAHDVAMVAAVRAAPLADDVMRLAPNIISVRHWDRLLGGLLYAVSPRVDWATLLRRSFSVDVLECPKCHGRLRMIAVITEREPARRILAHLGLPTDPLPVARARDPTVDADEAGDDGQLALGLA